MLEAIGERQFSTYFATIDRLLEPGGCACIQTILVPDERWHRYRTTPDWIERYVFPGCLIPSLGALWRGRWRAPSSSCTTSTRSGRTTPRRSRRWRASFHERLGEVRALGYDERFVRTWDFYLASARRSSGRAAPRRPAHPGQGRSVNAYELLERTRFREVAHRLYGVRIAGAEHVPASGPVILVANHESLFDPWLLALVTPRPVRYMAKAELWRYRPVARVLESFGAFPVERGTGDATAISRAAALLRDGEVLGMFPQGTSKRRASRPYHRGAARLALATGAPVVPVRMIGTRGFPHPGRPPTQIVVQEPIAVAPAKPTVAAARELTRRLEQTIAGPRDRTPLAAVAARLGARGGAARRLYLVQRRTRDATAVDAGWALSPRR